MLKRCFSLLLVCLMVIMFVPAFSEESDLETILLSETWKSVAGGRIAFEEGGTGILYSTNGTEIPITWTCDGDNMSYTFNSFGERTAALERGEMNGVTIIKNDETGVCFIPESQFNTATAGGDADCYQIALGEDIEIYFADMCFNGMEVTRRIGGDMIGIMPPEGFTYVIVNGSFANETNVEQSVGNICGEMILNDGITFSLEAQTLVSGNLVNTGKAKMPAMTSGEILLLAQVPDDIAANITSCCVRFGLNTDFSKKPLTLAQAEYRFELTMNDEALETAAAGPVRERVCFEECPVLPIPTSFCDVRNAGSSINTLNGKKTSIRYSYSPMFSQDDGIAVFNAYVEGLRSEGFTLNEDGANAYTILDGKTKLASFKFDRSKLSIEIVPGYENYTELKSMSNSESEGTISGVNGSEYYHLGDSVTINNVVLDFEAIDVANRIFSYTGREPSYYHYQEPDNGGRLFYLTGTYTNNSNVPHDIKNISTELIFDDQYHYSASFIGAGPNAENFIDDVAPFESVTFYVYASVPTKLLDSYSSCIIRLGFTDSYTIKISSMSGLYNFDVCDDVIDIEYVKQGSAAAGDTNLTEVTDTKTLKAVQEALNKAGYDCGTPDGVIGKKSRAAIEGYQKSHHLTVTGTVTQELVDDLNI